MRVLNIVAAAGLALAGSAQAQVSYVNGTDTNGDASWSNPDSQTYGMVSGTSGGHFAGWMLPNPAPGVGGTAFFDWAWSTTDSATGYDFPVETLNGQADYNNPPLNNPDGFSFGGGLSQSGSGSISVGAGDADFGWAVRQDGCCGNGTLDITNYNFVKIPAPGAAALIGLGGLAACRRRRA